MSKIEKWLEKNKPLKKKSNLYEFKQDILKMLELSYTQNQICECLKDVHQIETTQQNVSAFLKKELEAPKNVDVSKEVAEPQSDENEEEAKRKAELDKYFKKAKRL